MSSFDVISGLITAGPSSAKILVGDHQNFGRYWGGDVAEIIVYNRPLAPVERQTVERYLGRKYGVTVA